MNKHRVYRMGPRLTEVVAVAALACFLWAPRAFPAPQSNCDRSDVHCVDARPGKAEFLSIQAAVYRARPGDDVIVFPGRYRGFRVERSGTRRRRITITGLPGATVDAPEQQSAQGIYLANVSHVTVSGFEVDGGDRIYFGIAARDATPGHPMTNLEILDNEVHDTRSTGIYLSQVARSLVRGNTARRSGESHGIYLANAGSDDTRLVGNETYDNAVNGIHFNGDASVGGDGVHTGLTLSGNLVYHNGANGLDLDGVRDSLIVNNVVFDNGRHGLRAFAIDAAAGPANLRIVNNSFADNRGAAVKLTQDDGGHTIFNNVLLSESGSLIVGHGRFQSDYNVVGSGFSLDGEETLLDLAEWRGKGFDRRSPRASSRDVFVSTSAHNLLLVRRSVAENAGTRRLGRVKAPKKDAAGQRRRGKTDIGAYERPR